MEAYLYESLKDSKIQCHLCRHRCMIDNGKRGICNVRENRDGVLNTLVFGNLIARHTDPIEKKPLFHFFPGSSSYSIATVGCNFRCRFCQNADIAQMPTDRGGMIMGDRFTPEDIVAAAMQNNCRSISYTYTEPTIYFEFAYETARVAHAKGLKNVFVTNGYMSPEALEMIHPYLDAANVDLKAYNEEFYRSYCGARLSQVKETLKQMRALDIFLEVTTLLVPGLNDDPTELSGLTLFLRDELGPETPWHISRFHPTYRLIDRQPTPVETLTQAREIGLKVGLHYVYTGNVPGDSGESTYCHQCGEVLINRRGFSIRQNRIKNGCCDQCGTPVDGVGM